MWLKKSNHSLGHFLIVLSAIGILLITVASWVNLLYNVTSPTITPSSWFNMNISSAICFFLAGLILLFIATKNRLFLTDIFLVYLTILILLISSATLIEYFTGVYFNVHQFMSSEPGIVSHTPAMPFTSAINFILSGVSFLLILKKSESIWVTQTFAWLIVLITLLSIFNYLYGAEPYSGFTQYTTMSMQTMFLFMLISMSILLTNIDSGIVSIMLGKNNINYLFHWIIPIVIALPVILILIIFYLENNYLLDSSDIRVVRHAGLFAIAGIMVALIAVIFNRKEKALKNAQSDMLHNELIFLQFADNIEIVFYTTAPDLKKILYVSPAYEKIWGKTSESLYKNPTDWFDSIIPEDQGRAYEAFFVGVQQGKEKASAEFRIKRPDGTIRNIFSRIYQVKDELNQVFTIVGIAIDMTQITLEKRYKQIQHDLLNLMENEKNITEFFHKTLKMIARSLHIKFSGLWLIEESNLRCVDTWYDKNNSLNEFSLSCFKHAFKLGEGFPGVVWETKKPYFIANYSDNPTYSRARYAKEAGLNSCFGIPIIYQNKIFGIMEFFSDDIRNPDAKLLELIDDIGKSIGNYIVHTNALMQIQTISRHDLLTGLSNRSALEEELNNLIAKEKSNSIAVIVLDIDRFKLINEALGHDFGDKILKSVATRLIETSMNLGTIGLGRLGTDQFILYLTEINRQDTVGYAKTIQRKLYESFQVGQDIIHLSVAMGIAIYPKDGLDSKSLVINADLAMGKAKEQGGNRINFFTKDLPFFAAEAMAMVADLREAIKSKNQFILEYQPQVDLKTGDISAAEILVRWQHPTKGLIYPDKFISFAEKNNLIVPLNEHIMYMAFQKISSCELDIPISINISAQQFEDGFHLVECLESLMKEFAISTKQIELEITENMLLRDTEHNIAVLTAIHELGFQIAIDDFGTGFSSFNYLHRLPVQKIKIDKAFITGLPTNLDHVKIVKAIISLSHSLDKLVVAEGAESKTEVDYLKQENCDIVQGFYYYKPLSFEGLKAILDESA